MGHPLHIINIIIINNLVRSYNLNYTLSLDYKHPIPSDLLTFMLNSLIPKDYKKIEIMKWDQNTSDLVLCYNNYVDAVYDRKHQLIDYEERKWKNFKTLLENRHHNYSVHY